MNEEILLSIRNQLLINRALDLQSHPHESDPPEDLEQTGFKNRDGTPEMRLTYPAALRLAVREHVESSTLIQSFLGEMTRPD